MYLSLIIPAKNEQARLPRTLQEILSWLAWQPFRHQTEIIVIANACTDRTADIARDFGVGVIETPTSGKGHAVRLGMLNATGAIRMMLDADTSMYPSNIPAFLDLHEAQFSIVIGNRELRLSNRIGESLYRHWGGQVINRLTNLILPLGITDTQCGYKSFTAAAAHKIFPLVTTASYAFDVEVLAYAKLFGMEIGQVPLDWYASPESRVNPLRDALVFLDDVQIIKRSVNDYGHNHDSQVSDEVSTV
jgi:glycosyltransferase involved in cell wall biosynthesis